MSDRAAGMERQGLYRDCVWLGLWRSWLGQRSRKHAIARLGPLCTDLAVGARWAAVARQWVRRLKPLRLRVPRGFAGGEGVVLQLDLWRGRQVQLDRALFRERVGLD